MKVTKNFAFKTIHELLAGTLRYAPNNIPVYFWEIFLELLINCFIQCCLIFSKKNFHKKTQLALQSLHYLQKHAQIEKVELDAIDTAQMVVR